MNGDPRSRALRLRCKHLLLGLVACLCHHLLLLKLGNWFVRRFQAKRCKADAPAFPFLQKRKSQNLQILVYHQVNDSRDCFFPPVPVEVFERRMEYLASNFNVCPLADAVDMLRSGDVPDNTIVITFDDGYSDIYTNALPILQKLSIPATVFLTTASIGTGQVLWHDKLLAAFRETREPFLSWSGSASGSYPLGTLEEKLVAHEKILSSLMVLDDEERSFWIDRLVDQLKVETVAAPGLMLSWDEVKAMRGSGITFGSHTVHHSILSRLSRARAEAEIHESKRILEECLGKPVEAFAYPSGQSEDFDEVTKSIVREAGYTCALTTIFGTNAVGQDPFELRRGGPWEEHLPTFALKLHWYKFHCEREAP